MSGIVPMEASPDARFPDLVPTIGVASLPDDAASIDDGTTGLPGLLQGEEATEDELIEKGYPCNASTNCVAGVFGNDNRSPRSVADYGDTGHPYTLVGKVILWQPPSGGNPAYPVGHCTGFLVGRRVVMTNAHCVHDPITGFYYWHTFSPRHDGEQPSRWGTADYDGDGQKEVASEAAYVDPGFSAANVNNGTSNQHDKAFLILTNDAPNLGYWGVTVPSSSSNIGTIRTFGYPAGKRNVLYYGYTNNWQFDGNGRTMSTMVDITGGQSGSPLYSTTISSGRWVFALINTVGEGVRIDSDDIAVINYYRGLVP